MDTTVTDYLKREQTAAQRLLRVSFFPVAVALLFAGARSPGLRFTHRQGVELPRENGQQLGREAAQCPLVVRVQRERFA